jgi:hypothetical protein
MHPATGRQKTAVGLLQAGPRLPVPVYPIGTQATRLAHIGGKTTPNKQETNRTYPGVCCPPGGATTSGLRIGRKLLHDDAFTTILTSKGRWKFCQAKSGGFINFLRGKEHIPGQTAASEALCLVQTPVGLPNVIAGRVPESTGCAVNRPRCAFEFQKDAHRGLIQVQMKTMQSKYGTVFLVLEPRTQTERSKDVRPTEHG